MNDFLFDPIFAITGLIIALALGLFFGFLFGLVRYLLFGFLERKEK